MKGKATLKPDARELIYYDQVEKVATGAKTGKDNVVGRIYLPSDWVGKRVICLLLDELEIK